MEEQRPLKLNYKNTFKIAFAFFGILMLWQVYNTYCPIILEKMLQELGYTNTNYLIGIIMALDNVAAIIIMPIFGHLSDKTKTRFGKRMPYIAIGMLLTAIVFPFIALMCMWNMLAGVITFMMLFLIIMQSYRSPAVALMPDVTAKPLRSKANGLINLIGYFGGVFATVLGMFSIFKLNADSTLAEIQDKVIWPFVVCTAVFIVVLIFLIITIKENKMIDETKFDVAYGETMVDTLDVVDEDTNALSIKDRRNLIIILAAIFLWFMSFNAFETFGSLYFKNVVGDSTLYSTMATILSVVSILTFLTCSTLSYKIGRKFSVLLGLILITLALGLIAIISLYPGINLLNDEGNVYFGWKLFYMGMSVLIGIGWALVNINSFPMVVEHSNTKNLGKFTSLYYMSSMLAQSFTPVLVGLIMDFNVKGQKMLFVYSAGMMILAIIVFIFVKDKVNLKERKEIAKKLKGKSKLEILGDIDD